MSSRTIIEINHDFLHDLERLSHDELKQIIRNATDCNRSLNNSNGYGVGHGCGVTTLATRHHTNRLEVRVQDRCMYDNGSKEHRNIKE